MADAINWMCQGVALALVATGCSRMWRRAPAAARYRLWWTTLAAILATPALAFWSRPGPDVTATPAAVPPIFEVPDAGALVPAIVVGVWGLWSLISLARVAAAASAVRRMKRACTPFPEARERRLAHWNRVKRTGRDARLALSPCVGSAAVLGGPAPVIAVSPALLQKLDDEDLDRIVLHEWAHVQRRDDAAQFLQQIVRALFGLHPAVLWATRQLQLERELSCDEHVAVITGSPERYAASLVKLAGIVRARPAAAIPSAIGRSQMATRVLRLLDQSRGHAPRLSMAGTGAGVLLLMAGLAGSLSFRVAGNPAPLESMIVSARAPEHGASPQPVQSGARSAIGQVAERPSGLQTSRSSMTRSASRARADAVPPALPTNFSQFIVLGPGRPAGPATPDVPLRVGRLPGDASLNHVPGTPMPMQLPALSSRGGAASPTPWSAAAGAGLAIGRGSTNAARTTAGFFTRMGKSIGGRF